MGSIVLLDLMGGVALLLWGLHMVLSGVLRACGPDLRRFLGKALQNRFTAFGAGLGLTALLQSSTATGLMTTSLAADGVVSLVPALAIMLGANVGTTLIVQVLSFNISAAAPVLFIIGLITFRVGGQSLARAVGRICIGLGLILLALHILVDTLAPAEQAPAVRVLLGAITHDPVLCIVIAAALTWAAHSSVAVVLLIMSLAYSHFISAEAALALVLGANLGSAINPLLEGATRGDLASRRLPVGNLINRLVGILITLPVLPSLARELATLQPDAAKMTAEFHMLFNLALAVIFIGPLDAVASFLVRILPDRKQPADPSYAFESVKGHAEALYVCADPLVSSNRTGVNTLPFASRRPTMHAFREYVEAGGLMSYGASIPDLYRHAADLVDKILHGASQLTSRSSSPPNSNL
jgi:phosphate:Na+ symporter